MAKGSSRIVRAKASARAKAPNTSKARSEERKYPRIDERAAANFVSLQEVIHAARRNLPQDLWDHLSGG